MATFTKLKLSGSTDGKGILVVATATPGTLIHTADATALDEVWLYAATNDGSDRLLTVELGGVAISDLIRVNVIGDKGLALIVPGQILTNSLAVRAFGSAANKLNVFGWIHRIQ